MKSIPVAIVPVLNRFDLLTQLLESIDYLIDNLLIIDNSNSLENVDHADLQVAATKTIRPLVEPDSLSLLNVAIKIS